MWVVWTYEEYGYWTSGLLGDRVLGDIAGS
jgi:hypothetical protein